MSIVSELKSQVANLRSSKHKSAVSEYRALLAKDSQKPGEVERLVELCEMLGVDESRIDVHGMILSSLATLAATEASIRKLASTEGDKRASRDALAAELAETVRVARLRLAEANDLLEVAYRAVERVRDIGALRDEITAAFGWLINGDGSDSTPADKARQISERVAILANVDTLAVKPGEPLRSLGSEPGGLPLAG